VRGWKLHASGVLGCRGARRGESGKDSRQTCWLAAAAAVAAGWESVPLPRREGRAAATLLGTECSSVERVHRWFCRRLQGLPTQVSSAVALAELGRQPLRLFWVRQLVRYWNRLLASLGEPDRPLAWAFEDNLALMREGTDLATGSPCWCRRWQQFLQSAPTDSGMMVWLTELRESDVLERARAAHHRQSVQPAETKTTSKTPPAQLQQPMAAAPTPAATHRGSSPAVAPLAMPGGAGGSPARVASHGLGLVGAAPHQAQSRPGHGVGPPNAEPPPTAADTCCSTNKFAYYLEHVCGGHPHSHSPPLSQLAPHLGLVPNIKHRIALSRFRCSCHDLRIERESYLPKELKAPLHERTCLMCASPSAIEDEIHMVFHCTLYDSLRFQYADLFPLDLPTSLHSFLSQDQKRVAAFIHDCSVLRRRNACMSLAGSESAL